MPSSSKQPRLSDDDEPRSASSDASDGASDADMEPMDSQDEGEESSLDTDDEIAAGKPKKSKQTLKRKRRATEPSRFGATLQSLLSTGAPSAAPLSLKPSIARKRNDQKLELKAKKALQGERKDREDKGRVTDVLGEWGAENERALRKVAQRGVIRLFNAIQQSQNSSAQAAKDVSSRGTGKPSLPAPLIEDSKTKKKTKGKDKDNILGRGKDAAVNKDDFFDLIRSGGVVSTA